jgi:MFS family permease
MGLLLSGFFWTYALMQMPFGWFVDKVGARIALPLAVAWWSLFTAATAAASTLATMFGCRLMLGVGEAGAYPSCAKIVSQWFDARVVRHYRGGGRDMGDRLVADLQGTAGRCRH